MRRFIVPPDIVAVRRTSPLPVRKHTPWRPRPDGETTARGGTREWFGDRIFTTAHQPHIRTACGTSMTAHVSCLAAVLMVLVARPYDPPQVRAGPPLLMPATLAMVTIPHGPAPRPASQPVERATPVPTPPPPPAVSPLHSSTTAPAPIEAPSGFTPATVAEPATDDAPGGVAGGISGGVAGDGVGGVPAGSRLVGPGASRPMRVGSGIQPPRKIKDVRPTYPLGALSDQSRGIVVIEAVVDADGRVSEAQVVQSVPALDQAALDAVWQWEFEPSRLDGVAVAVIITVVVQFSIH